MTDFEQKMFNEKAIAICPDNEEHKYHRLGQTCPQCSSIATALREVSEGKDKEIERLKKDVAFYELAPEVGTNRAFDNLQAELTKARGEVERLTIIAQANCEDSECFYKYKLSVSKEIVNKYEEALTKIINYEPKQPLLNVYELAKQALDEAKQLEEGS